MDDFFGSNDKIKCQKCSLNSKAIKAKVGKNKLAKSILRKVDNPEFLFIFESNPSPYMLKLIHEQLNYRLGTSKIDYVVGIDCSLSTEDYPSPIYKHFETCNTLKDLNLLDYKAIITSGRGIFALTKSDDLTQYHDFTESNFSDTFFYTSVNDSILKRVYPLPPTYEFVKGDYRIQSEKSPFDQRFYDRWETFYFYKQLDFIKEFKDSYTEEKLKPYNMHLIDDPNTFLEKHMDAKPCAWDLETSGLDMWVDGFTIKCMTLSFDGVEGYYLPFDKINKRVLKRFLSNKYSIMANGKYDLKCLAMFGIEDVVMHEDITILFRMLNTERKSNSIKALSWLIGFGGYEKDLDNYIKKYKIKSYIDIDDNIMFDYSVKDAIVTFRLWELAKGLLERQPNVKMCYYKYVMPVFKTYLEAELTGFPIDIDYLNNLDTQYRKVLVSLEVEIRKELGDININSLDELGNALKRKGLPCMGWNEKGIYKTGEPQLQNWKEAGFEIADLLLKHREISKLLTTYLGFIPQGSSEEGEEEVEFFGKRPEKINEAKIKGLAVHIKKDGRIHPDMTPARAESGRTTHCITGDSKILTDKGEIKIKDLYEVKGEDYYTVTHLGNNKRIKNVFKNGKKDVYLLRLSNGQELKITDNHEVFTDKGFIRVKDLKSSHKIAKIYD
jgi:hypothetical protein